MPSKNGRVKSMTTSSGRVSSTIPSASLPSAASPTTSNSPVTSRTSRSSSSISDRDLKDNEYDVVGFEADNITAWYTKPGQGSYEFRISDFRVETPGRVYSALVDQIRDGTLWILVDRNSAQSSVDGHGNTRSFRTWQVDAPAPQPAAEGSSIWTDTLTVGGENTGILGYYIGWKQGHSNDVRHGELPNSEFEYNSTNYEILGLSYTDGWSVVRLSMCPRLEGAKSSFELRLGDDYVTFDADNSSTRNFRRTKDGSVQNCRQYDWDQVDLDWNHGDSVTVRITR